MRKKNKICIDCGAKLNECGATRCRSCYRKSRMVCEWPTRETLKNMIRNDPFLKIGAKFGVSDNAVRKWCKQYSLPYKKSDISAMSDAEWASI